MIFTLFDIIIIAIIIISALFGIYKGMVNITVNLLGFVASIIFAIFLYPYVLSFLIGYVENELVGSIVSGILAYVVSLIIFTFLTSKMVLLLDGSCKGFLDRTLGLLLGIIRGILFALIIFAITAIATAGTYSDAKIAEDLVFDLNQDDYPEWLQKSTTTPYLEKALKSSVAMLPEDFLRSIKMPEYKKPKKDENIIDAIKRRKNGVMPDSENISEILELEPEDSEE